MPNRDAARKEAVIYTASALRGKQHEFWQGHDLWVEVANEAGEVLFTIVMSATDLPS